MINMTKRLVQFTIIDGTEEDIRNLSIALGKIKEKLGDIEFIVSNERIIARDVKELVIELYQKEKELIELKNKAVKKSE